MSNSWPGKSGEAWRIVYQPDNPNNRTVHIRAIVDELLVVFAYRSSVGWRYHSSDREFFEMLWRDGRLKRSQAKGPVS